MMDYPGDLRARILLVDDDPGVTGLVKNFLEGIGYEVRAVNDPAEAEAAIERFDPNLVVVDFDMPHLLGTDLALRLRKNPRTAGLPIVFLSGMTEDDHRTMGRLSGASAYLSKPVRLMDLASTLRALLGPGEAKDPPGPFDSGEPR